ncbi:M28 family peptidase [Polaribacter glomeratus]|uniref:Aminopeptidase n=1 Tax=Polaribacter glomeratus TaxID=102 RepID=A0A2S7WV27_9FLAO|nr:M28 family peptidase [Polaribacter glomeratus]PQJ81469.1 aminopeptidase [Polaribacter glomeratus]TXD64728.1 M28 family peptidase [Polaribacter glomeratus]
MKLKKTTLLLIALSLTITLKAQTEKEKVIETTSKAKIEGHIYFLADDLLKGRETGTPENKIAASYLANTLRSYGVKPNPKTGTFYQDVKLKRASYPADVAIEINGQQIKEYALIVPSAINTNADAVYLNYGLKNDYNGKNIKGKVIIIKSGSEEIKDARAAYGLLEKKQELAKANGVVAIIELLDTDKNMWELIKHHFNAPRMIVAKNKKADKSDDTDIPHLWTLDEKHKTATVFSSIKKMTAKVEMSEKTEEIVMSQNVIGFIEGTDPKLKEEFIIYSAHYDHVGIGKPDETGDTIYNGARDNAIGTTTVLSIAENLVKYPTKRSALFILFTGEEKGLLGSEFYVENPVLPLKQMVYCFNSDNAGYNDTSLVTIMGLSRTTVAQHIKDAAATFGLTAIDDPAPEQGLFDRSDNVNFAKKGIPAPTFSLGFTAFNGDVTKYYHQPGDEADTLDYDYLLKFFRSYILSGRKIGNDLKTPVWTGGDKYEEASKALYGN